MRLWAVASLLFLAGAAPAQAAPQGLSARFGNLVATLGEDFSPRLEITDPLGVVDRVLLEARPRGEARWRRTDATRAESGDWWQGTFTSTSIYATHGAEPEALELRAKVFGKRGGLLLDLGGLEPLDVPVLTKPEVEQRERAFRIYSPGDDEEDGLFWLTGYIGSEGRANSGARARLVIGAGGALTDLIELILYVSIGPAFDRPQALDGGGPIVLGVEAATRIFTRPPSQYDLSLFVEPNLQVDLRFPGVDPGIGLRGGVSYRAGTDIAVELALGGALLWLRAIEPNIDSEIGFAGTLRLALRFGGPRLVEAIR